MWFPCYYSVSLVKILLARDSLNHNKLRVHGIDVLSYLTTANRNSCRILFFQNNICFVRKYLRTLCCGSTAQCISLICIDYQSSTFIHESSCSLYSLRDCNCGKSLTFYVILSVLRQPYSSRIATRNCFSPLTRQFTTHI